MKMKNASGPRRAANFLLALGDVNQRKSPRCFDMCVLSMRTILIPRTLGISLCFLLLCSCATTPEPSAIISASELPADVTINKDAGRGNLLFVTLRLENGEELPFVVDTGMPITVFDKSLEPKLGKRLGPHTILMLGRENESSVYVAPKLYLGSTPLMMTGPLILTCDLKQISSHSGRSVMGILGMDVLEHYCIQLDFEAWKMRFLDPDDVNATKLGKAFPLTFSSEGESNMKAIRPFIHHDSLIGGKGTQLLIDTGGLVDGVMKPRLPPQEIRKQRGDVTTGGTAHFPECVWEGETYTNITINTWPIHAQDPNTLGLRFLARHLVTLDFPKRTMYLKRTSIGPLVDEGMKQR